MPRSPKGTDDAADRPTRSRGEVYVEYKQVGQAMKVVAIDADTGTEVAIMGPVSASQNDLQRIAVRKLRAQLEKAKSDPVATQDGDDDDEGPGPKGWVA